MLKNARRRPTCKITWKRVRFCRTGVALRTPWMQKSFKSIEILPWNHHKKYECRCCNGQQRTLSIDLRTCIKTRWCLSLPVLLCSRHGCEIRSNNRKSSMVTFNLSTVVPAARRANSKCIIAKEKNLTHWFRYRKMRFTLACARMVLRQLYTHCLPPSNAL